MGTPIAQLKNIYSNQNTLTTILKNIPYSASFLRIQYIDVFYISFLPFSLTFNGTTFPLIKIQLQIKPNNVTPLKLYHITK